MLVAVALLACTASCKNCWKCKATLSKQTFCGNMAAYEADQFMYEHAGQNPSCTPPED